MANNLPREQEVVSRNMLLPNVYGVFNLAGRFCDDAWTDCCREQRARMDVDEPTAKAVGGEILPMIFVVSKAIEYIKNQILDRVVSPSISV